MALSSRMTRKIKALSSYIGIRPLSISTHPQPSEEVTGEPRFLLHSSPEPKLSDHSPTLLFPETRISTLSNGIRVVTQSSPTSAVQTASVGVWIDAGSRFETPQTNGTAHFLEHMIFKGTRRRSARALEEEIENMGARLNAYTSREQTTFYANVLCDDVPIAVDILADILQNSRFSENAIRRERGVILREMEEVQGQAEEVIFDHLHSAAFRNNLLGNTILGPQENIQMISKMDLYQYISTHYTGPRMVVSAAGAVKHEEIVNQVSRQFKQLSTDPTTAAQLVDRNPAIFTGSEVRVVNNDSPIAHLAIAFKGSGWADPNSIPVMVLQSLLGSWNKSVGVGNYSGSELARRVSADDLAESIMAFNTNYCDTGLFGIYSTAMPDCLPSLSLAIMQEFRRMAHQISEADVMRARNQLKSALLLHIDGTSAVAENNGRQMLTYGRIVPFLELFARIDAVDAATIKETAKEFIINKDVAIAAMGPVHQLPDYDWFRSQTCMH
ncbi:probable mitochondrial-processing peptidase subunit beta, mitochondrial [Magnolia sinica]|uniref:probable mitochondrial-processing peptidase subunit beta, mitochondrial n=1 Tax=Magnolia sinica TaxID=86752 RepID=UPI0026583279|nr:probable mitochondrial-processing peptidase subunit beta, mitochondrial [Magnolia sinica]